MTYEIKIMEKIAGHTSRRSYLTDSYRFTETDKRGKQICFKAEGKKTNTYLLAERWSFHEDYELVISEATTGRYIERIV